MNEAKRKITPSGLDIMARTNAKPDKVKINFLFTVVVVNTVEPSTNNNAKPRETKNVNIEVSSPPVAYALKSL